MLILLFKILPSTFFRSIQKFFIKRASYWELFARRFLCNYFGFILYWSTQF